MSFLNVLIFHTVQKIYSLQCFMNSPHVSLKLLFYFFHHSSSYQCGKEEFVFVAIYSLFTENFLYVLHLFNVPIICKTFFIHPSNTYIHMLTYLYVQLQWRGEKFLTQSIKKTLELWNVHVILKIHILNPFSSFLNLPKDNSTRIIEKDHCFFSLIQKLLNTTSYKYISVCVCVCVCVWR